MKLLIYLKWEFHVDESIDILYIVVYVTNVSQSARSRVPRLSTQHHSDVSHRSTHMATLGKPQRSNTLKARFCFVLIEVKHCKGIKQRLPFVLVQHVLV